MSLQKLQLLNYPSSENILIFILFSVTIFFRNFCCRDFISETYNLTAFVEHSIKQKSLNIKQKVSRKVY
ncbi:hypothetical protein TNCV_408011 [Trichonephila clavipes]|nr:hypothetical protein TNCV_408011 [Trichonephila clavipes]